MLEQKEYWKSRIFYSKPQRFATRLFVESKLNYIFKFLKADSSSSILDVGAGNGTFTYYWIKYFKQVVGIDISDALISQSPCRDKMIIGDAFRLPFKNNAFDVVFTSCLLHHVHTPLDVVKELARAAKKYVVICEPNRNNPLMLLFSVMFNWERGGIKFSRNFLRGLVDKCGSLETIALDSMGVITPNLTPSCIARIIRGLDKENIFGLYNLLIAKKRNENIISYPPI